MWVAKSFLQKINSQYNGQIKVYKQFGRVQMEAGGLLQSGGVLKNIWKKALKKSILSDHSPVKSLKVLILGLGAGTLAQLISKKWPQAKITGVEIDPQVIKIGQKYFDLNKINQLTIINQDAFKFIEKTQLKYDLIFVDLYQGDKFPGQAQTPDFFHQLKSSLLANGLVVFNHLFWGNHKKSAEKFIRQLEQVFSCVELKRSLCNLMIYASCQLSPREKDLKRLK